MSASDFEDRKNRLDVSRYAPPKYRMRDGAATIGPVLERLSRGVSDGDPDLTAAQAVPPAEPIHIQQEQDALPSPKIPLSTTARLAVAMSLAAVLAAVSVTILRSKAEHPAPAASADTSKSIPSKSIETTATADKPKPVRTVTVRREEATVGEAQASAVVQRAAPSQAGASFAERVEAVEAKPARPRPEVPLALTSPLKMWAMFPGNPSAEEQDAATRSARAANQARRRRYTRRRRTRAAAAKPQQEQAVESAQTQATVDQLIKKIPLQAAIDAIFGSRDDSSDSASGNTAPATTGAAFQ